MKKTLCAVILGLTSLSAFSYDGNEIYDWAKEWKSDSGSQFKGGVYAGFVLGVDAASQETVYCVPRTVINEQMLDVVLDYLKSHPVERTKEASELIRTALAAAYPCQKK